MNRLLLFFLMINIELFRAQTEAPLVLFNDNRSDYRISVNDPTSTFENHAKKIITSYFLEVSNINLEENNGKFRLKIFDVGNKLTSESFIIKNEGNNIILEGNAKGLVYGAYTFVEQILGCRKFVPGEKAFSPFVEKIEIPLPFKIKEQPAFIFREVYSMAETDQEYLDWHKIHDLDQLWGIWGHSFDRLVPPSYFKTHPEYFAYYNGRRHATQLCLSNENVFNISIKNLQEMVNDNPGTKYWSVSPNDNSGFCECKFCKAENTKDGGNQGSLLKFVNRIAQYFPEKTFTTLAYNSTAKPPLVTKPKKNVIIFLSNVEATRTFSMDKDASAEKFRKNLKGWSEKTDQIFIWDYYTQFTNFLAPFPNYFTIQPNFNYYKENKTKGVFAQLNGQEYGDFAELKTYLLAKLLWNPTLDQNKLISDFLTGYYKTAAPYIRNYMTQLYGFAVNSETKLDIYGNPVNDYDDFLSPENISALNLLMDEAETAANKDSIVLERLGKLRLSLDYTFLQQAKFYGLKKYSVLNDSSEWILSDDFKNRVKELTQKAQKANIKTLSEEGISPQEYSAEWQEIFQEGIKENLALDAEFHLKYDFAPEYPAKKEKTLTDGTPGYGDFSYNWLCFYEIPMVATLDLKKIQQIKEIEMNFLEDLRHWIIRPKSVKVEFSPDGKKYKKAASLKLEIPTENYDVQKINLGFKNLNIKARFLRITAENQPKFPSFIFSKNKKPMIACDEIWVK